MGHRALKALLVIGLVVGLMAGFRSWHHHGHLHGGWHGHGHHGFGHYGQRDDLERHVADVCVEAARRHDAKQ